MRQAPRGRPFQPGQSGNPGGRPVIVGKLRELARAHALGAIAELARLAKDAKSETARIAAIKELLDRAYDKPTQFVAAEDDEPALTKRARCCVLSHRLKILRAIWTCPSQSSEHSEGRPLTAPGDSFASYFMSTKLGAPMLLSPDDFYSVVRLAPLVSIDLIIRNARGEVLLGLRNNEPAKGFYFVPGGIILKQERLHEAFARILKARDQIRRARVASRPCKTRSWPKKMPTYVDIYNSKI